MANPAVESITETTNLTPADATLDVTLDNADSAGDLLIMVLCTHPDTDTYTVSGWTELDDYKRGVGSHSGWIGYKEASGSEGSTIVVTSSATPDVFAAQVYRISNWDSGQAPEDNNFFNIAGTTTTPDPQSITQTWGADDNLFITFIIHTDDAATVTTYPSGWTTGADTTADGGNNESCQVSSAYLFDNSSTTVDPGAWTITAAEAVSDVTVAVLGGAGGAAANNAIPLLHHLRHHGR